MNRQALIDSAGDDAEYVEDLVLKYLGYSGIRRVLACRMDELERILTKYREDGVVICEDGAYTMNDYYVSDKVHKDGNMHTERLAYLIIVYGECAEYVSEYNKCRRMREEVFSSGNTELYERYGKYEQE